jgi:hypothetical protein
MRQTRKREGKTISIRLPSKTSARVIKLARERKVSVSELVRQAIDQFDGPTIWEQVEPVIGRRGSGLGDLSTNPRHLEGLGGK